MVERMHIGERERAAAAPFFFALRADRQQNPGQTARAPEHVHARRHRLKESTRACAAPGDKIFSGFAPKTGVIAFGHARVLQTRILLGAADAGA